MVWTASDDNVSFAPAIPKDFGDGIWEFWSEECGNLVANYLSIEFPASNASNLSQHSSCPSNKVAT